MRRALALMAAMVLLSPLAVGAQEGRAALEKVSAALGAASVKTLQFTASGSNFAVGQSYAPGVAWPRINVKSMTRTVNYETRSLRDEFVRTQALDPPRGGGGQPISGEQRQNFNVSGDHAWNVAGDAATSAPITLVDRQFQLWSTPHGVVKAAMAGNATVSGRFITFSVPGRFTLRATVDDRGLIEKVEGVIPNAVLGDMPVEVAYADYRDFGGVKFPTKIRQTAGGYPSLDVTVSDVRVNVPADIAVPDAVRQAANPYTRVTADKVADGVWYLTGGTHHSVVIEMKDHVIVVEGPLNDQRALAVIAEARKLVPTKPIRYMINSHHHFDHAGGVRAFAGEGITIITHEVNRPFLQQITAAPATVSPDHLARSGLRGRVEAVGEKEILTDGTRVVELHHIAGFGHHEGTVMVYLPKERLLVQADAYNPLPPNAAPPTPPHPGHVALADNIARLRLGVDQILALHVRAVPMSELNRMVGR